MSAMKLKPLGDRVLVKPEPMEQKTAGGILLPGNATNKEKPMRGVVVAIGPGKRITQGDGEKRIAIEGVEVGSRVFYSKYAGNEITLNFGEEDALVVLREEDLLAVEEA